MVRSLRAALLCALIIWPASAGAQTAPVETSPRKAAKPAAKEWSPPKGIKAERDVPYIPEGDASQRLDLYLPETPAEHPLPLLVHIHGGGWRGGSKFPCPVIGMVAKGYAVASIEYRFSQQATFPAQIQDCQAAIRWLRAHKEQYQLDPDHVGAIGGSAGGHLSALVGTTGGKHVFPPIGGNEEQSDRVQAVCDYFGPTDFGTVMQQAEDDPNVRNIFKFNSPTDPYSLLIGVPLGSDRAKTDAVSPVHFISPDSPPILILHGDYDSLVPYAQSEEFAKALREKGVEVWLQKLPGSGHGGPAFGKPEVIALIQKFFDKHLKGASVDLQLIPESTLAVDPPKPASR